MGQGARLSGSLGSPLDASASTGSSSSCDTPSFEESRGSLSSEGLGSPDPRHAEIVQEDATVEVDLGLVRLDAEGDVGGKPEKSGEVTPKGGGGNPQIIISETAVAQA
jgi:hypothetical protein